VGFLGGEMQKEIIKKSIEKKNILHYLNNKKNNRWENVMLATNRLIEYFIVLRKNAKKN